MEGGFHSDGIDWLRLEQEEMYRQELNKRQIQRQLYDRQELNKIQIQRQLDHKLYQKQNAHRWNASYGTLCLGFSWSQYQNSLSHFTLPLETKLNSPNKLLSGKLKQQEEEVKQF